MKNKFLNEEQYNVCMRALGYTFDVQLEHFFIGENAFLGNVNDDIAEVGDLIKINENGYPTFMAQVLSDFMSKGANLIIGDGAIDLSGKKFTKALYCTNYRELFSNKKKVRSR